jgi:pimeloyl-ACP methyl ester carboxylesterase
MRPEWMAAHSSYPRRSSFLPTVLSAFLVLFVFVLISLIAVCAFLVYQALHPSKTAASSVDLDAMVGHPAAISFSVPGGSRDGWFFPGFRGAPAIVVCHGYQSQRVNVLTLVTALQEHQFNVFTFDFRGNGSSAGMTTLGYRETDELRSAMQALAGRDDVDSQRFGLWGVDMGGYAALEVAAGDSRVGAIAVDDAFADPKDMFQLQAKQSGLTAIPFVLKGSTFGFRAFEYPFLDEPSVATKLSQIKAPKLFIVSDDRPELASETIKLFDAAPDPKRLLRDNQSYRDMSDDDRKTYESQIVNFFLQYLPPAGR